MPLHGNKMVLDDQPRATGATHEGLEFLSKLMAADGILCGLDLLDGSEYSVIVPEDRAAFLRAHLEGPGAGVPPAAMGVTTTDGDRRRVETFVRARVRPSSPERCTHLALRFPTESSLVPGGQVLNAASSLMKEGRSVYVERSFNIARWVLWLPFDGAVDREEAIESAMAVRFTLVGSGVDADEYTLPLVDDPTLEFHLPLSSLGASYFGRVFLLEQSGPAPALRELGSVPRPGNSRPRPTNELEAASLFAVLDRWIADHGQRPFRAGELLDFAYRARCVPQSLLDVPRQASSIRLGRALLRHVRSGSARHPVEAIRSGNSYSIRTIDVR